MGARHGRRGGKNAFTPLPRLPPLKHLRVVNAEPAVIEEVREQSDHVAKIIQIFRNGRRAADDNALIGGCDALVVGEFMEARGVRDELAERLALNTQLLLRDESYFGCVADPAAGSWYIETLTERMLGGAGIDVAATGFVGVNRYPNRKEAPPQTVTPGRAMSAFEEDRKRSGVPVE